MKFRLHVAKGPLVFLAALLAAGFIALAVVGCGTWMRFAAKPAHLEIAISLLALATITPLCGCNVDKAIEQHQDNDWIFWPLLLMGLLMGWISAYCDRTNLLVVGGSEIRHLGVIIFLAGAVLRIGAIRTLKNQFSVWVAIQKDHQLYTTGLYRFVRHPSYTGAILNLLGWAIAFRSIVGIALACAMGMLLVTRIGAEEKLLVGTFGKEYREYQERSWKLLPLVY